MNNYVLEFINRVKEEVDPAEWFFFNNDYCFDTNEVSAYYIVPDGRLIEGSLLGHDTILVVARESDSEPRVKSSDLIPNAVIRSDKLGITFDVYFIL